jgi:hypothetical protein
MPRMLFDIAPPAPPRERFKPYLWLAFLSAVISFLTTLLLR